MIEQWRDIPGYEGIYEASNTGKIRTAKDKVTQSARFSRRVWKQRELKPKYELRKSGLNKDARVNLWKDGVCRTLLVARLIAMAWVDGYVEGMTVNHIDGNSLNNNADNLEWLSRADNIRHGFDNGAYKSNQRSCVLFNEYGDAYHFESLSAVDRFLNRHNGYTRTALFRNQKILRSLNGEIFAV